MKNALVLEKTGLGVIFDGKKTNEFAHILHRHLVRRVPGRCSVWELVKAAKRLQNDWPSRAA